MTAIHTGKLLEVPISGLIESKTNPRGDYDKTSLVELAESIKQQGLLQPILVRVNEDAQSFEIICGARRYRAAVIAKLDTVPCRVVELDDDEVYAVQIVENLQRQDIHPLDEAAGFQTLLGRMNGEVRRVSAAVGKPDAYIIQRVKLLDLIPPAKKLFKDGKIGYQHARILCRLTAETQAEALKTIDRDASWQALAQWVEQRASAALKAAPWKLDDAELVKEAGACSACPKNTSANRGLFGDLEEGVCTDKLCFQNKLTAFVQISLAKAKDANKGNEVLTLSDRYGTSEKGAIPNDKWKPAKKGSCEYVQPGVLAESWDTKKLGSRLLVCVKKGCPEHWEREEATGNPEREQIKKDRIEKATRIRVLDSSVKGITQNRLDRAMMERVALSMFIRLWGDMQRRVVKHFGWKDDQKKDEHGWERVVAKRVTDMSDCHLVRFIVFLAYAPSITGVGIGEDELKKFAKEQNIDVKAITKTVAEEFAPKKKK